MTWSEGDVRVDGAGLHYYRRGRGPAVVLAHGALDDGRCWTRVAEALEDDFELIAYDARFHGKSDAPADLPFGHGAGGMRRGPDDLVGVIDALGLERPYAIGHSMGAGTVAAALAARPDLIRAAVLEDPAWTESPLDRAAAGTFIKAFADSLSGRTVEELETMCAEMSPTWDPAEFRPWAESKAAFRGADVIGGSGVGADDWQMLCTKFACPVLLVCGGNEAAGRIVSPSVAARARELCPTLEVACFDEAGHNVRREAFEGFVAAAREFLSRS
jgi:pimeloyl-ACP methyl ester carboxylesterase